MACIVIKIIDTISPMVKLTKFCCLFPLSQYSVSFFIALFIFPHPTFFSFSTQITKPVTSPRTSSFLSGGTLFNNSTNSFESSFFCLIFSVHAVLLFIILSHLTCLFYVPLCLYIIPLCLFCQYIFCVFVDRGEFWVYSEFNIT